MFAEHLDAPLASPYLSHLVQYRGIPRAEIVFAIEELLVPLTFDDTRSSKQRIETAGRA
jgi:hypothetical protein